MLVNGKQPRSWADRAAIGLSGLCAVHCLLMPVAITLVPAVGGLGLGDEAFHLWMVVVVIPISIYALLSGCRQHKRFSVPALGFTGLAVLVAALIFGHDLGEVAERALTLAGALLIAWSHLMNYRFCQTQTSCECTD